MSSSYGTIRSRVTEAERLPDSTYFENLYGTIYSYRQKHNFVEGQKTWSSENPLWHTQQAERNNPGSQGFTQPHLREWLLGLDSGAEFTTVRYSYDDDVTPVTLWDTDGSGQFLRKWDFTGRLYPVYARADYRNFVAWSQGDVISRADLIAKGTTAIARTIPTHPAVGVSTILGELRQGLPSVPGKAIVWDPVRNSRRNKRRRRNSRNQPSRARKGANGLKRGSSEFLNWTFAVAPAIADVQALAKNVSESERILAQLERDSGRLVRRRYSFPDQITNELVSTKTGVYLQDAPLNARFYPAGGGTLVHRRKTVRKVWFSGAYTYYFRAGGDDLRGKISDAKNYAEHVLGLRIDPEMAWNLSPWSWLADWKTNMGDVMTNISAFSRDSLVLRWGYVMETVTVTNSYTWTGTLLRVGPKSFTQNFTTTVKKRVKATPYGFGLDSDWRSFTGRQVAILGALGITRAL